MIDGKTIKYGDNVDTDVIIPARYLNISDTWELTTHCMEDLDSEYFNKLKGGSSIIVAGKNFGCGSSREHAPLVIKESGIKLVIAETFARIFYRNAINIGLTIIECPKAVLEADDEDVFSADPKKGILTNKTKGKTYSIIPFPEFMQEIINAGGLVEYTKKRVTL
ncbi:MAG: leuD [Clostridiales bacterium]|jgi:3-isopropylmalate/(R)-2-methylmalate dehydratase small subunit|nr:leuD [Clostridiales bacterium]